MTEYSVIRWPDEIGATPPEILYAHSLEDAVALLRACGDEILVSENGVRRSLTKREEKRISSLMKKRIISRRA